MLCLTLSGDVCCFAPNIVKSTLFSEQLSLFDPRDNNKSNQTYFYKSSVKFTTPQHFFSVVHFTPVGLWMCISHYISWTKLSKVTNFVWY